MPARSRTAADRLPGRRAVLGAGMAAGAAVLVSGCGVRIGSPAGPVAAAAPGADELARDRVARDADALRSLAVRAAALRPADRAVLAAVAADHRAHAAALRPPVGSATSSPAPAPAAGVPGSPAMTAATALVTLARAERAAAAAATSELDRVGPDVARLLASVAASRSLHVSLLDARLAAASRARR